MRKLIFTHIVREYFITTYFIASVPPYSTALYSTRLNSSTLTVQRPPSLLLHVFELTLNRFLHLAIVDEAIFIAFREAV